MIRQCCSNAPVDVAHKREGGGEAHRPQHQEEGVADDSVVPEEEGRLQQAVHVRADEVVVEAVPVDEDAG